MILASLSTTMQIQVLFIFVCNIKGEPLVASKKSNPYVIDHLQWSYALNNYTKNSI
jgi:hypothetical protein